jgi:N-carbamoyl-L-amino-acid hydrolase
MNNLRVDGSRLWDSLMEMARIGATPKGGVCRLALSDLDKQGRDLLVRWCEAAGCTCHGRSRRQHLRPPPGSDPARPAS